MEKTEVYGVESDDPRLSEFYKRFDGMAFEAEGGGITIYLNNGCSYDPAEQGLPVSESFNMWLKETFDVEISDTLMAWTIPPFSCKDLELDVLVFPEKIFLVDEGRICGAFKKVGFKEYLAASGLDSLESFTYSIMMGMVELYWYENKTLAETYALLLEKFPTETKPLKKTLPATNISYKYSEGENTGTIHISYEYINANHLVVELFYGISFVYLDFSIIDDNWALIRIRHYAD